MSKNTIKLITFLLCVLTSYKQLIPLSLKLKLIYNLNNNHHHYLFFSSSIYLYNYARRSRAYHLPLFHGRYRLVSRRARLYGSSPGGADVAEHRRQKHGAQNSDDGAAADK